MTPPDPLERHDLAAGQPERVNRMQAALTAWFEDMDQDRRNIGD